jgi:hypothetical protein
MRKAGILVLCLFCFLSFSFLGCGQKGAVSGREAIDISKTLETAEEKVDYLVGQAKAFYNSERFQEAIDVAQYILSALDKDSQEAKDLLEKAKQKLVEAAKGAAEDMKKKLGDIGK